MMATRLFVQAYGATHPEPELSRYLARSFSSEFFAEQIAGPDSAVLLALTESGASCAYAHLRLTTGPLPADVQSDRAVEIVRFYVDSVWHGRGIAQKLMAACERLAKEWGADLLWLGVWQLAARPIAFYRRAGFEIVGTTTFLFGERRDADFVMARPLGAAE